MVALTKWVRKLKLNFFYKIGTKLNDLWKIKDEHKYVDTHREFHSSRGYINNTKIFYWQGSYMLFTQWHKLYTQRKPACCLKVKEATGFRCIASQIFSEHVACAIGWKTHFHRLFSTVYEQWFIAMTTVWW